MTATTVDGPRASGVTGRRDAKLRRAFWGIMISFVLHGLIVSTWVSRIASVKTQLHLGDGALGLALLGTAIGSVSAIPVCGWAVGRFGGRNTVRLTGLGFCVALIMPALAWSELTLFLALLFYGAMAGANDVAMNAEAVSTEKLLGTPTMSRFHAMFSVGGIAGAGLGAFVASRGLAALPHLAIGGAVFAVLAVLAPSLMVDTHQTDIPAAGETGVLALFRRVPVALVALSGIGFCIFLSEGAVADWVGVYLKQVLGASEGMVPMGYAVFSVAMAIFRFAGDAITMRIGRGAMIRAGGTLAAAGVALAISVHSIEWALGGFAAAGAGFSSIIPLVFAAGGRVKSVSAGVGVAMVSGLGYLGFLAGPPAIGFISEMSSLRFGLVLLVVLSALAALLVSVVERSSGADSNPLSDSS